MLLHFRLCIKIAVFLPPNFVFLNGSDAEEDSIRNLARLSTKERIKKIQKMPEAMKKKREIR